MNIFTTIKLADVVTLANLGAGVLSLFFAIQHFFVFAAILLFAAVVFDALDGAVARKIKQANVFGKELDSLSDLVSFGVAPAVFGFTQGLTSPFAVVLLMIFVLAGALRLCRFNVTATEGYEGVPITFNGLLFPLLFFFSLAYPFPVLGYLAAYMIMSILMVSTFKVPKLSF